MVSRTNESRAIVSTHGTSHRLPRLKARSAKAKAPISSASPQLSVSGKEEWWTSGGGRRSLRSPPPRSRAGSAGAATRRGRAPPRRSPRARGRAASAFPRPVERRAGEGHRHAPLVERLVVSDPRRVARLLRVAGAELRGDRAAKVCRIACVVARAAELQHPRLVVQGVRRPAHRVARGRPDRAHESTASVPAASAMTTLLTSSGWASPGRRRQPPSVQGSRRCRHFREGALPRGESSPARDRPIAGRVAGAQPSHNGVHGGDAEAGGPRRRARGRTT